VCDQLPGLSGDGVTYYPALLQLQRGTWTPSDLLGQGERVIPTVGSVGLSVPFCTRTSNWLQLWLSAAEWGNTCLSLQGKSQLLENLQHSVHLSQMKSVASMKREMR